MKRLNGKETRTERKRMRREGTYNYRNSCLALVFITGLLAFGWALLIAFICGVVWIMIHVLEWCQSVLGANIALKETFTAFAQAIFLSVGLYCLAVLIMGGA